MKRKHTKAYERLKVLFYIAFVNGIACIFVASQIGGDAISGHSKDGHYFLANHGKFTEVPLWVYLYSFMHMLITIPVTAVVVFTGWWLQLTDRMYEKG